MSEIYKEKNLVSIFLKKYLNWKICVRKKNVEHKDFPKETF